MECGSGIARLRAPGEAVTDGVYEKPIHSPDLQSRSRLRSPSLDHYSELVICSATARFTSASTSSRLLVPGPVAKDRRTPAHPIHAGNLQRWAAVVRHHDSGARKIEVQTSGHPKTFE